jgi:hypothetical protein
MLRRASPAQPAIREETDMSDMHGWKPVAQDDGDDDDKDDKDGDEEEDE